MSGGVLTTEGAAELTTESGKLLMTEDFVGAGRHRKRYGVYDGKRLLAFNTRAEAQSAREALARKVKIRIKGA